MLNFHKDHKKLVITALLVYLALSIVIAVLPAYQMQAVQPLPNQPALSETQLNGLHIFVRENCMSCHTQQVRNIEMDKVWGDRPSMPSDYYYSKQRLDVWRQSASLLGSERTGPDLSNVGQRQPAQAWHLLHFFNPRIVVKESIMPSYPWLFEEKEKSDITEEDLVVPVPLDFQKNPDKKVVAGTDVLDLIAYLQTLKLTPLPANSAPKFISSSKTETEKSDPEGKNVTVADGEQLYLQNCAACHQPKGNGLPGAFPPLAGSSIVKDKDPEFLVKVILQGYDARSEYAQMPGFATQLSDEEISAIINHERTSWGNQASPVPPTEVSKIRAEVMNELNP